MSGESQLHYTGTHNWLKLKYFLWNIVAVDLNM